MVLRPVVLQWEGKTETLRQLERPLPPLEGEEIVLSPRERHEPREHIPLTYMDATATLRADGTSTRRLVLGDAVDVARALEHQGLAGKVDLVYLDPPYGSGADYCHEERLEGRATGVVTRATAYRDRWEDGPASYLDMLYPRLVAIRPLLNPTGSIWIQVDWRASYLVRALCDEIFGRERFFNEIVWRRAPNLGRQARSGQFGRTLDTIVVYGGGPDARLIPPRQLSPLKGGSFHTDKTTGRPYTVAPRGDYTDKSVARLEREGRIHRTATGNIYVKYWLEKDAAGNLCKRQTLDALWTDIPPLRHVSPEERTGYPTQKPRALLERIISAGSPEGGLVVDLFAGSGTTGAAAAALGRRFVLGDNSPVALAIMRNRLERDHIGYTVEVCGCRSPRASTNVSLEAARLDPDHIDVRLNCAESRDLVCWAIGLTPVQGESLQVLWQASRGTGRRPKEMPMNAIVPVATPIKVVRTRLYFVNGATLDADAVVHDARSLPSSCTGGAVSTETDP